MYEELAVSLIVLAISSVTYVAYKHPTFYSKVLFNKLYFAALALYLPVGAWSLSNTVTLNRVLEFVPAADRAAVITAAEAVTISANVATLVLFAACAYFLFLSWLAHHFERDQRTGSGEA